MKFIEELRQRPEEERLAFAALSAGLIGLVLFLVWGMTFFRSSANTAEIEISGQQASVSETILQAQSDISNVMGDFSTQYQQFQQALEEAKSTEETGKNTVQLSVDKNGDVSVDNIVIPREELEESQTQ